MPEPGKARPAFEQIIEATGRLRLIPATSTVLSRIFAVEGRGHFLFRAAEQLDLEGIVAQRKADLFGPGTEWLKMRNRAYTQMAGRWELFQQRQ